MRWPPVTSSPSRPADVDVGRDLVDGLGVDERPDVRRGVEPGPEAQRPRPRLEPAEQVHRATGRSTMTRLAAVQRWPVVPKADQRIPSVARSRSASARTTIPFLPPSSRLTRFSRRAARSAIRLPVADDPVNEMTGTSGESTIASPTSAPPPVTRLTVPAGNPASAISSTTRVAQWGVSLAGLNTTVLPVTSAGIIFQHGIAIGKFQGVMIPATPIGWRMLIAHLSGSSDGTVSPNIRRPSPAIR